MNIGDQVKILRGKYKGKAGIFCCWTEKHPLSSERRAQVRVFGFGDHRTLLINESGFYRRTPAPSF